MRRTTTAGVLLALVLGLAGCSGASHPENLPPADDPVAWVGRLPLVDALGVSGPPPRAEAASTVRARDLLARTSVRDGVSFDGPVLLVDDTAKDAVDANGCIGAVGRSRRAPGVAARRPPAPLGAT